MGGNVVIQDKFVGRLWHFCAFAMGRWLFRIIMTKENGLPRRLRQLAMTKSHPCHSEEGAARRENPHPGAKGAVILNETKCSEESIR